MDIIFYYYCFRLPVGGIIIISCSCCCSKLKLELKLKWRRKRGARSGNKTKSKNKKMLIIPFLPFLRTLPSSRTQNQNQNQNMTGILKQGKEWHMTDRHNVERWNTTNTIPQEFTRYDDIWFSLSRRNWNWNWIEIDRTMMMMTDLILFSFSFTFSFDLPIEQWHY